MLWWSVNWVLSWCNSSHHVILSKVQHWNSPYRVSWPIVSKASAKWPLTVYVCRSKYRLSQVYLGSARGFSPILERRHTLHTVCNNSKIKSLSAYYVLYFTLSTILYYTVLYNYTINRVGILVCFVIKPHIKAYIIDYTCAHTSYLSQTPQTCLCKNFCQV